MVETPPSNFAAEPFRIEGVLAIETVTDWSRRLTDRWSCAPALAVDLEKVTSIDVFGLQLLCALRRSARASGRELIFASVPPIVAEACAAAGLSTQQFLST